MNAATGTKPPLVLDLTREHQKYATLDGKQQVGVTTALAVYEKNLDYWTATEEREGILALMATSPLPMTAPELRAWLPTKDGKPALFAFTKRDKAADFGTVGHAHIEAWVTGTYLSEVGIPADVYEESTVCVRRFMQWWESHGMTLVQSEVQMTSETWRCGGTADLIGRAPDGLLELWDVKTGKPWYKGHPYDEQVAQTAAYAAMYAEVHGESIARIRIARVGKTAGDKGDLYLVPDAARALGESLFTKALGAYREKQEMGRVLKAAGKVLAKG